MLTGWIPVLFKDATFKIKEPTYGFNQNADVVATLSPSPRDNFCASAKHNDSPNTFSIDSAALISSGSDCSGAGGASTKGQTFESYNETQFIDDCNRIMGSIPRGTQTFYGGNTDDENWSGGWGPGDWDKLGFFVAVASDGSVVHGGTRDNTKTFRNTCSQAAALLDPIPQNHLEDSWGSVCCRNCSKRQQDSIKRIDLEREMAGLEPLPSGEPLEIPCKMVFVGPTDKVLKAGLQRKHPAAYEEERLKGTSHSMLQYNFETGVFVDNSNGKKYKNGELVE